MTKPTGEFTFTENPILKYVPKDPWSRGRFALSPDKPSKNYRIIVVGDSVSYGSCKGEGAIAPKDTFAAVLEDLLNAERPIRNKKFELANLSVPGYNTVTEAEYLKVYGLPLKPDLVIVAYNVNDYCVGNPLELRKLKKYQNPSLFADWGPAAYQSSALVRYLWRFSSIFDEKNVCTWEIPKEGFQKIRAMGEEYGFTTLVAVVPSLKWADKYPGDLKYNKVRKLAEDAGLGVLDLFEALKTEVSDFQTLEGRCTRDHPDEHGHSIIAKALNKHLRENYLGKTK